MALLLCCKEKDGNINKAIEEAVQLERDQAKETMSNERVSKIVSLVYCIGILACI